jgi:hypothetical protein
VVVSLAAGPEHVPDQPSWACSSCGKDWPCDPARERLTHDHRDDPVALSVWMGAQLGLAALEMERVTPEELYTRFVAWTRPPPLPLDAEVTR